MRTSPVQRMVVLLLGCLLFLCPSLSALLSPTMVDSSVADDALIIPLDCSNISGVIRPYGHINDGPTPIKDDPRYVDLTSQYRDIGITSIRTHDLFGPTDMTTIFPDWNADPTNASNYHFETSDPLITRMIQAGSHVFYRLGESAGDNETLRSPPSNFTKWAEVCKHISMHYNDGWNQGFSYNIVYWEVWNEPDLTGFWNGTADQYYELYHITADTMKAWNASLKIGGPCTSSVTNTNYTTRFLQYVTDHDVPLDFFSWHRYATSPFEMYNASRCIRSLLDSYGLSDAENINTEWNLDILTPQRDKDNARNAAFTACCLTVFQDAGLDFAYRYRGNQENNWLMRFLGLDLSLFTYKGMYKRPALTYLVFKDISQDTPLRLSTPIMDASTGVTYLAGISEDRTNLSILLSNFDAGDTPYTLELSHLPWDAPYTVAHYVIDETHHLEIEDKTTVDTSNYTFTQTLPSNSVHFYRFTNSSVIPAEGPGVANIPFLLRLQFLDPLARILSILIILLILS
jgi:Glycosyl hydrolases family 39